MSKRKSLEGLFAGRHFDRDVIILCVRWYLRYKLSPNAMLGFKRFRNAVTTVAGIELMHRIRKGRCRLNCLHLKEATMPTAWNAFPAAQ